MKLLPLTLIKGSFQTRLHLKIRFGCLNIFNAAQPGVGRVQVLGSKSLEEGDYLAIKSLEVDWRVPAWRVF